ncbi:MAG: hypothetical protein AABX85_00975 [Nanoarchaeota archaeon]
MENIKLPDKLSILVVEDTPKHINDVRMEFENRISRGTSLDVKYATNLLDALYSFQSADGIISDVFYPIGNASPDSNLENFLASFPRDNGIEASGVSLAEHTEKKGIPIVLCTDAHHHRASITQVYHFANKKGIFFIPNWMREHNDVIEKKHWASAYGRLVNTMARKFAGFPYTFTPYLWNFDLKRPVVSPEMKEKHNAFVRKFSLDEDFKISRYEPERAYLEEI